MSERTDLAFLADILEAIRRIESYVTGITFQEFLVDTKTQDAVIRNLEIIGEATKNLSGSLQTAHPEIPWKNMARIRDRLIHHYFGISVEIVWQVASDELPKVAPEIEKILSEL